MVITRCPCCAGSHLIACSAPQASWKTEIEPYFSLVTQHRRLCRISYCLYAAWLIILFATFYFVSYPRFYRLHFSLLELQVCAHVHLILGSYWHISRNRKKMFCGYSSWPYDDLQRCCTWIYFKADGIWVLGLTWLTLRLRKVKLGFDQLKSYRCVTWRYSTLLGLFLSNV